MPWKNTSFQNQRSEFIADYLRRKSSLSELCRRWSISRKTAYKWIARFIAKGCAGLHDRPRCCLRVGNRPKRLWLERIRRWRRLHPSWGAAKLHWALERRFGSRNLPSQAAIGRWLKAWQLTGKPARLRHRGAPEQRPRLSAARRPNDVWTVDFKGWFRTADRTRIEPLTIRDLSSRMILAVELLGKPTVEQSRPVFEKLFRRHGLPRAIRSDNGTPFGSSGALGLTRLSAWWVKLGIRVEFIEPGRPDQNGAHEQVHRVYKAETMQPPARTHRAQKQRTKRWIKTYNHERPHQALGMRVPAELYRKSTRKMPRTNKPWKYPKSWQSRLVKGKGMISLEGQGRYIGEAFERERIGLKRTESGHWKVYYGPHQLGKLSRQENTGIRAKWYRKKKRR
jgi:putative transposase